MARHDVIKKLKEEAAHYKHKVHGKVKFAEVDSVGVVHNVQYFYMFEWARIEYLQNLGLKISPDTFLQQLPLLMARNEIDYISTLRFCDEYTILSRVKELKKSSFVFNQMVLDKSGEPVARGESVLVHIDPVTKSSTPLPDFLRQVVIEFEN